ncbi:hypothetical protein J6590_104802 [Homalodisca vitripennis]|nr:hypothetical protein J6590_104802 [Homalodisca vitripennis]
MAIKKERALGEKVWVIVPPDKVIQVEFIYEDGHGDIFGDSMSSEYSQGASLPVHYHGELQPWSREGRRVARRTRRQPRRGCEPVRLERCGRALAPSSALRARPTVEDWV